MAQNIRENLQQQTWSKKETALATATRNKKYTDHTPEPVQIQNHVLHYTLHI